MKYPYCWEKFMARARIFVFAIGLSALLGFGVAAVLVAAPTQAVAGCSTRC
jgi:hypothetical protein